MNQKLLEDILINLCLKVQFRLFPIENHFLEDMRQWDPCVFAGAVPGAVQEQHFSLVNVQPDIVFNLDILETERGTCPNQLVFF